jgi:hypothetical protein
VSSAGAARISLLSESEAESSSSSRRRTSGRREAVRPAPAPVRGGRPRARTGDGTVGREGCARRRGPRADSPAAADYRGAHDFVSLVSHGRDPTAAVEALERRRGRGYDRMCSPPRSPTPIRCYARRILPTRGGGRPRRRAAAGRGGLDGGASVGCLGLRRVRRPQGTCAPPLSDRGACLGSP